MKHGKQFMFRFHPWFYINWFSIPTKEFGTYGRRLCINIGNLHMMFDWKPRVKNDHEGNR